MNFYTVGEIMCYGLLWQRHTFFPTLCGKALPYMLFIQFSLRCVCFYVKEEYVDC